jgi:methyltransferase
MVTRWVFTGLIVLLALQRIYELRLSSRNEAIIRSRGGREHAAWQVQVMKVLHAGWFIAMLLEVYGLRRPFLPNLFLLALLTLIVGQSLRYAAITALGWRWTVKVMTLPGLPLVRKGIYRYLRHPNYLGVVLEILAVPLLHSAYVTAILFSLANMLLLSARIRTEDQALLEAVNGAPLPESAGEATGGYVHSKRRTG